MRAGHLRHRVTIRKPDPSRSAGTAGQLVPTFITVASNVPAGIEPLNGREEVIAAHRGAETTHMVTLRYSSDLAAMDATWSFLFGSRVLTLDGPPINVGERNRELKCACSEGLRTEE